MFDAISRRLAGLRARYAEPHRAHHTQVHIDAMLAGLREPGGAIAQTDTVELAIRYHDAIYDPAAADNERRSADLLRAELAGMADPAMLPRRRRWSVGLPTTASRSACHPMKQGCGARGIPESPNA